MPEEYPNCDISFKVIIIGNSCKTFFLFNLLFKNIGVGKEELTAHFKKESFSNNYNSTIGFEFYKYNIKINNKKIRL